MCVSGEATMVAGVVEGRKDVRAKQQAQYLGTRAQKINNEQRRGEDGRLLI
jgi:hypothetical protein